MSSEETAKRSYLSSNQNADCIAKLAVTTMVPVHATRHDYSTTCDPCNSTDSTAETCTRQTSPVIRETQTASYSTVKHAYLAEGFPQDAVETILQSRKTATYRQYDSFTKQWFRFCTRRQVAPLHPDIGTVLTFFQLILKEKNLGFSAMLTARASLNALFEPVECKVLQSPHITRYFQGLLHILPRKPKYEHVWDSQVVLNMLKTRGPGQKLSLQKLTVKTLVLALLMSGQRIQTMAALDTKFMKVNRASITFEIQESLKHTKRHNTVVKFSTFPADRRLCVVSYLKHYLERTNAVRASSFLFVTTQKPHNRASRATLSRWTKLVLRQAGISTEFSSHSTRAAATSAAHEAGVPVNTIMNTASWKSNSTFAQWYKKPISKSLTLQQALLNSHK